MSTPIMTNNRKIPLISTVEAVNSAVRAAGSSGTDDKDAQMQVARVIAALLYVPPDALFTVNVRMIDKQTRFVACESNDRMLAFQFYVCGLSR